MPRLGHLRFLLLALPLALAPVGGALADDLAATGGVFFRLPFAADGSGPQKPRFGMGIGHTALPSHGLSLDLDSNGEARLGVVGFQWSWQLPDPALWWQDEPAAAETGHPLDSGTASDLLIP